MPRSRVLTGRDQPRFLAPEDPHVHASRGHVCYHDRDASLEDALDGFSRALALDSRQHWATLYRAHCLQDLERWGEAAEAYDAVNPAFLVGPCRWRFEFLLEQRAWCLLRAGHRDRARSAFTLLINRYQDQPHLAQERAFFDHLIAAVTADLNELLDDVRDLFERLGPEFRAFHGRDQAELLERLES